MFNLISPHPLYHHPLRIKSIKWSLGNNLYNAGRPPSRTGFQILWAVSDNLNLNWFPFHSPFPGAGACPFHCATIKHSKNGWSCYLSQTLVTINHISIQIFAQFPQVKFPSTFLSPCHCPSSASLIRPVYKSRIVHRPTTSLQQQKRNTTTNLTTIRQRERQSKEKQSEAKWSKAPSKQGRKQKTKTNAAAAELPFAHFELRHLFPLPPTSAIFQPPSAP